MNSPGNCSPLHVDCALSQVISVTAARTHTFAPRTLLLVTIKERKNKKERKKKHDWTATAFPNRPKRDGALLAEAKERKKSFLFPEKTRLQPQDSLSGKTEKKNLLQRSESAFPEAKVYKSAVWRTGPTPGAPARPCAHILRLCALSIVVFLSEGMWTWCAASGPLDPPPLPAGTLHRSLLLLMLELVDVL